MYITSCHPSLSKSASAAPHSTKRFSTASPDAVETSSNWPFPVERYSAGMSSAKCVFTRSSRPSSSKSPMPTPMPAWAMPFSLRALPLGTATSVNVPS